MKGAPASAATSGGSALAIAGTASTPGDNVGYQAAQLVKGGEFGRMAAMQADACVSVAIADVAHYVRPGARLDREAQLRGNSVYFPDRVVPMLPEVLSADVCSLRAGEDRGRIYRVAPKGSARRAQSVSPNTIIMTKVKSQ